MKFHTVNHGHFVSKVIHSQDIHTLLLEYTTCKAPHPIHNVWFAGRIKEVDSKFMVVAGSSCTFR